MTYAVTRLRLAGTAFSGSPPIPSSKSVAARGPGLPRTPPELGVGLSDHWQVFWTDLPHKLSLTEGAPFASSGLSRFPS